MANPEFRAVLPGRHVLMISATGRVMDLSLAGRSYFRPTAQDMMAQTWEVFTEAQLMRMGRGEEPGPLGFLTGELVAQEEAPIRRRRAS